MNREVKIVKSKAEANYNEIAKLGAIIWHEHYIPIIGLKQVEYMLEKFQSVKAISEQIKNGYEYYTILLGQESIGYLSIQKQKESLFLSKIYILTNYRGKGIGSKAMSFINKRATELKCRKIALTVNKYNTNSIKSYEKLGFKNVGAIVQDIGGGFVMDDYQMEKHI